MGIQSTKDITRKQAIDRIIDIGIAIKDRDYRTIEEWTFDPENDLQEFVDKYASIDLSHVHKWTNKMLENWMDKPFFRWSMFDNYFVKD